MPPKIHGWIVTDAEGRLITDHHGNVLLFTRYDEYLKGITPFGGLVRMVVTAPVPRKRKLKETI